MLRKKRESRSVGIYSRKEKLFIYPLSKTTSGLLVASEPVITLNQTASDEELGEAILNSLDRYRTGIPHPTDFQNLPQSPILKAAGVKSWSAFSKAALACMVTEDGSTLTMTPSHKPTSTGYLFLPEREVKLGMPAAPTQIGAALREALSRCE